MAENEDVDGIELTEEEKKEKALLAIIEDLDNLVDLKYRNQGITITTGNLKGGVSKTTTNILLAYCLAKRGIRTLLVDMDQQANATWSMRLTKKRAEGEDDTVPIFKSIMGNFLGENINETIIPIVENLDLLPANADMRSFAKHLYTRVPENVNIDFLLKNLLDPIKHNYDIILIDTPPHSTEITNNVAVASDYVFIPLQTQEYSLTGALTYYEDLEELVGKYGLKLALLGVVPVMLSKQSVSDAKYLEEAVIQFGPDILFRTVITNMERIKKFATVGIGGDDHHDKTVLQKYDMFTNELVHRINLYEDIRRMED